MIKRVVGGPRGLLDQGISNEHQGDREGGCGPYITRVDAESAHGAELARLVEVVPVEAPQEFEIRPVKVMVGSRRGQRLLDVSSRQIGQKTVIKSVRKHSKAVHFSREIEDVSAVLASTKRNQGIVGMATLSNRVKSLNQEFFWKWNKGAVRRAMITSALLIESRVGICLGEDTAAATYSHWITPQVYFYDSHQTSSWTSIYSFVSQQDSH